ncbi:MAG: aconitate hydratase B, partial [Gammaproteobacteria bacterium]|nr:aconitate hydratase B [Gammaproteobacteria bacterium]
MLQAYRDHTAERETEGIPPKPLDAQQVADLIELIKNPPAGEDQYLLELLTQHVPAGVDEAAYVKAGFLAAVCSGELNTDLIDAVKAVEILGTMLGGYNIQPLIAALDRDNTAAAAVKALSHTLLIFDAFHDIKEKSDAGNAYAAQVIESWANAEWFTSKPALAEKITVSIFKVPGETNTDDLSPAQDAWSRPDIPLHANAFLKNPREGLTDKPLQKIQQLKALGHPIAYVGDVVGTGSSRKSATNSVLWHMGKDIPYIPNKNNGGYCFGAKIAPIFFNTMEDAGALPVEMDVSRLEMGDVVDLYPYRGIVTKHNSDEELSSFKLATNVLQDEVRAGGRIPLIFGRGRTERARTALDLPPSDIFEVPESP